MTTIIPSAPALPACGARPDSVEACLDAVACAADRLFVASFNRWRDGRMAGVLAEARAAAALVDGLRDALADAFAPATEQAIAREGARLLRSWPQAKHGDLGGYGAELALLIAERRPSQRALEQTCRTLKLTKVHLPAIAEVIGALDEAERVLQARGERLAALPGRIARAEVMISQPRTIPKSIAVAET